jgi:hypothetical protein
MLQTWKGEKNLFLMRFSHTCMTSVPEGWLREVCQPWRRAVLLDTDEAALGEDEGGRGANRGEAKIVTKIVKVFDFFKNSVFGY